MKQVKVWVADDGSVVVPAELCAALGLKAGDPVLVRLQDGEVQLIGQMEAIRRVQDWAQQYMPPERASVDDFLRERREEAERE